MLKYINVGISFFGSIFSVFTLIFILSSRWNNTKDNKKYILLLIINTIILLSDMFANFYAGTNYSYTRFILITCTFLSIALSYVLMGMFNGYFVKYLASLGIVTRKIYKVIVLVWAVIGIVMLIVSQFSNLFYTFDENNMYTRKLGFMWFYGYGLLGMFFCLLYYIKNIKKLNPSQRIFLFGSCFFPIIATIPQLLLSEPTLLYMTNAIVVILMYILIQVEFSKRQMELDITLAKNNLFLTERKRAIMLSQIQPHFLYNALGAIRELCVSDPKKAEKATIDFSEFLRGNMDSLTTEKLIPFTQELQHTKHYLDLEKMRFEERLEIVYDINTSDFRMPTLALQPIVENAVRYGITKREEGGTLTITTKEDKNNYIIIVEDDGIGFDIHKKHEDGRSHIGINNVSERIKTMCNGSLDIVSTENVGTVATITIPKEIN